MSRVASFGANLGRSGPAAAAAVPPMRLMRTTLRMGPERVAGVRDVAACGEAAGRLGTPAGDVGLGDLVERNPPSAGVLPVPG